MVPLAPTGHSHPHQVHANFNCGTHSDSRAQAKSYAKATRQPAAATVAHDSR
jgi:hypothetical protein